MSLEYFIVPESKEVLNTHTHTHTHTHVCMYTQRWGYVRRTQKSSERAPNGQSWGNLSHKINTVVLAESSSIR